MDAKKKTLQATEQDPVKRAAWREEAATTPAEAFVFLDETGATIRLTRPYARAPRGQRAVGRVPRNHGTATTLIAGLTLNGLLACRRYAGAMTKVRFLAYLREDLCPLLRPGQVVAMDNLSAHHNAEVRRLIEAAGCELRYVPAYSPDLSPIELAYAKVKAGLKRIGARTQDALDTAIETVVVTVTADDARGFFHHCGYSLAQSL